MWDPPGQSFVNPYILALKIFWCSFSPYQSNQHQWRRLPPLLSSTRTNCRTGNNPPLTFPRTYVADPLSPPSIYWYRRLWYPTLKDTRSNSSPPSPTLSQGRWGLLLQIRQQSWTLSQAVPAWGRYKTSEVSPPSTLCEIVSHSWTHLRLWDNLRLYLSMPRWIHISTTLPPPLILLPVYLWLEAFWPIIPKQFPPSVRYATNQPSI